jgi:hypothetical protein
MCMYMISLLNRIFFNNYNLTVSNFLTNSKRLRSILEKIKHFHCNTKKENSLTVMYIENGWSLTVHFSVNNFDSNLSKPADLILQITKFFDKCCPNWTWHVIFKNRQVL